MPKPDIANDPRLDPRIKALLDNFPDPEIHDYDTREELLAAQNTPEAEERQKALETFMQLCDNEDVSPSKGLAVSTLEFTSQPDGNTIKVLFTRPEGDEVVPCVYYIHGGGMMILSAFYGNYRAWSRLMAQQGVAVAMVDFRNCMTPSSAPEVAPYPAGLDDCVSGFHWLRSQARELGIDASRIVIAGESGGGNLTLATGMRLLREGKSDEVKGLYALCPYIAGRWPLPENPSSTENNGILLDLHNEAGALAYGIEELEKKNPLAWPGFASEADVQGLPKVMISVNECDPLRDEGIGFYRLLLRAGVPARCRQVMGTAHASDTMPILCPDICGDTARSIADFCREG
ncbi:MAG: alpha/beta hydrolase fold domain-containing protein [Myxococcota bacterium]|nr:alpha/beta hydrolase fold domain-containing protein [Myxococcota bacterium]MDP6242928.1 alpha/beta hydrolase fold domain-containing protein [Myxococcota bacterium]MDP7076599.1 alpha/beta hydrolase fold domain-containing protein [Myxococcota bacterium]MDP7298318.1 alpha/beta hydrolase fold domain-containing protein [Myxococcota bacterium]MDP7431024.1 alpha/beta hydrolase fold domain-containing protein [Myxococcota bacterium]